MRACTLPADAWTARARTICSQVSGTRTGCCDAGRVYSTMRTQRARARLRSERRIGLLT